MSRQDEKKLKPPTRAEYHAALDDMWALFHCDHDNFSTVIDAADVLWRGFKRLKLTTTLGLVNQKSGQPVPDQEPR